MRKVFGLAALALAVAFSSCTKDDVLETGNGPDLNTALSFSFKAPQGSFVTRAIASNDEFNITKLDVYASVSGTVGALTGSQTAAAAGDDYWYTFDTSNNTYTITMTNDWIKDHLTQTVSFYFVGNDATSTEGTHDDLTETAEADFKKALTDALGTTSGQLNLIHQVNGVANAGKDLLFSAVIENIKVQGKVQKSSDLKRVESRFDVENEYYKDDAYKVTEIRVSNASRQGVIFPNAGIDFTDASIAGSRLSHVPIGGIAETAYDATTKLAESVFYLYPTEMSSVAGDGKTEITLMVSYDGAAAVPFRVDASAVNYEIEANKRYIIVLEPTEVVARLKIADWDDAGDPLPAKPAGDDAMTLSAITGTAVGNLSGNIYTIGATGGLLEFTATTQYGTEFEVTDVLNNGSALGFTNASVVKTSIVTYGYTTVDTYKITVPTSSDANNYYFRLTISSPNGKASESIIFSKGTVSIDEQFAGNPSLAEALKDFFGTDEITAEMIENTTTLGQSGSNTILGNINSLDGLEIFPNLTGVSVWNNSNITGHLDLSHLPKLEIIDISATGVTSVNLSNNQELTEFWATGSIGLTNVDLNNNPKLKSLGLAQTGVEIIDFELENLETLQVGSGGAGTDPTIVDLTGMPNLATLRILGTKLEHLSKSSAYRLSSTSLKTLDIRGYTGTTPYSAERRSVKTIDISGLPALETFSATTLPKLTNVTGAESCPNLTTFYAYLDRYMTDADGRNIKESFTVLPAHPTLKSLVISYSDIKNLTLSNSDFPALTGLAAAYISYLETIDLSDITTLQSINVRSCYALSTLDISNNRSVTNLNVAGSSPTVRYLTVNVWPGFDKNNVATAHFVNGWDTGWCVVDWTGWEVE